MEKHNGIHVSRTAGSNTPDLSVGGGTPQWSRAACRNEDPEKFFTDGKESSPAVKNRINAAKMICIVECPIQSTCLNWALDTGQDHGVWGGTSPDERRAMRRNRLQQGAVPARSNGRRG